MLEGLIHSYLEAFGRGWAPRDELAYPVHETRQKGSRLIIAGDAGIGSFHATRRTRTRRNRAGRSGLQPQTL